MNVGLACFLAVPLASMGVIGVLGSWALSRRQRRTDWPVELHLTNPFSLTAALKFGAFFILVFFLVEAGNQLLGRQGIYLVSVLAGAGDASAITLSAAGRVSEGSLSVSAAALVVSLAATANAAVKWVLALTGGTRELAIWLGGGLVAMLGIGYGLLALVHQLGLGCG